MWQWRGQRKQWTRPLASGSHQHASCSACVFWRTLSSPMILLLRLLYSVQRRNLREGLNRLRVLAMREARSGGAVPNPAPFSRPVREPLELVPVLPAQLKEFPRGHAGGFFSQKRLEPPLQVGARPGPQTVSARSNPIEPQRLPHWFYPSQSRLLSAERCG